VLKLDNNRKTLYQWDVGVVGTLTIDGVDEVHFSNLRYGVSFNIKVVDNKVEFPPEVLQSGADVFCWAFVREENGGYTKKEQIFNVEKRPRPADYVYEPTEVLNWETLKKEIEKLDENTDKALADLEKGKEDKSNKLTEYTEVETDEEYYSAKSVNEMLVNIGEMLEILNKENDEKFTELYSGILEIIQAAQVENNGKFATKEDLESLKTEIQGDLDEIGDLVGGETEGDGEEVVILPLGEYEFVPYPEADTVEGWSNLWLTDLDLPPIIADGAYILTFNGESQSIILKNSEDNPSVSGNTLGLYCAGNLYAYNYGDEDTGENYLLIIDTRAIGTQEEKYCIDLYVRSDGGTYPVSLSYKGATQ
jgi:hypothetical protein